jgi:sulfur carrier protein ThiS
VPQGTTTPQVVAMLDLPKGFPVIIMVNGSSCSDLARRVLEEEDIVLVSPVMAGG